MGISYTDVKSAVALRSAQLAGFDSASLETAYTAYTVDGAELPISDLRNAIVATEKQIAEAIAETPSHPYRSYLYGRSADLADLASTPTEDNANVPFIGKWDSCSDSATGRPCTWMPVQTIADIVDNASGFFGPSNFFYYVLNGNTIRCTRPTVYLEGCVFDTDAAFTAFDADGESPLPPTLTNLWIAGTLANLSQVGWVGTESLSYYAGMFEKGIAEIYQGGGANIPLASQNVISG